MPRTVRRSAHGETQGERHGMNQRSGLVWTAALACCACLAAGSAQATQEEVFFEDFTHVGKEPDRIALAGGSAVLIWKHLRPWRNWGDPSTKASGKYRYNTCQPSCAEGTIKWTSATVRLSDIKSCGGELHYRTIKSRTSGKIGDFKLRLDCNGSVYRADLPGTDGGPADRGCAPVLNGAYYVGATNMACSNARRVATKAIQGDNQNAKWKMHWCRLRVWPLPWPRSAKGQDRPLGSE
jgi:hypothetical protein